VTDQSAVASPIAGTGIVNTAPTQVNLGTITVPFAPTTIIGTLNDITVSDNRGGTFGWSLTASLTDFTGAGGATMSRAQLSAAPTCSAASSSAAWDYTAPGQTPIPGFNASTSAPGITAGGTQSFAGTVGLCTKDTSANALSQSSGGVYTISAPLTLTVQSFQAADRYTAIMQITLA
jgi:hypothetical protein